MVSVKYALSKEDYVNYYTYVMWDAPEKKKAKLKYYLRQVGFYVLVIAVLFYTGVFQYNRSVLYIYLGIMLFTTAMQIFNARNNIKKQAQKIANATNNQSIFLDTQIDISETGISMKDELSETKLQWKAFVKKQENADYYFLFTNSIQALIFPKRIFKTAEDKARFQQLLSQHLSFDAEVGHLIKG